MRTSCLLSLLLVLGCGAESTSTPAPDAGPADVAVDSPDVTETDDPGSPPVDVPPAPTPSPFGTIQGACDAPQILGGFAVNTFAFDGDPFSADDLDADALAIFDEPNAGGSSKCSEIFSFVVLDHCLDADLYKTETGLAYDVAGSIADYAVDAGVERIGVSVTRAYKGPVVQEYSEEDAITLLTKKLEGMAEATQNVTANDAWSRSLLHVWTLHAEWADVVGDALSTLPPELKAGIAVVVTIETGTDFVVTDSCDD